MSETPNWMQRGQAGFQKAAEIKARQDMGYGPRRFFLTKRASAEIVFLDGKESDGVFIWEHNVAIDGRYGNCFTCLKDFAPCPICERSENKRYYGVAFTVINLTGYTKKDGTVVKGQKELLMIKSGQFDKLALKRKNAGGDLTGCLFNFTRVGAPKEPAVGSEWDFVKKVDLNQLERYKPADVSLEEWLKPFDYMKILEPKPYDEICKILGWPLKGQAVGGYSPSQGDALSQMDAMPAPPPGVSTMDEKAIDDLL